MGSYVINILSFVIGVLGVILAIKFSQKKRISIFATYYQSLIEIVEEVKKHVNISYKGILTKDLNRFELIFQNSGNVVIDGLDIINENPLSFYVGNNNKIFDFRVRSSNDEIIEPVIKKVADDKINLTFTILRPKDYIRIILFTDISASDQLRVSGRIKNMSYLDKIKIIKSSNLYELARARKFSLYFSVLLLISSMFLSIHLAELNMDSYFPNPNENIKIISAKIINHDLMNISKEFTMETATDSSARVFALYYLFNENVRRLFKKLKSIDDSTRSSVHEKELFPVSLGDEGFFLKAKNLGFKKRKTFIDTLGNVLLLTKEEYEKPSRFDFYIKYYFSFESPGISILIMFLFILSFISIVISFNSFKKYYDILDIKDKNNMFLLNRLFK